MALDYFFQTQEQKTRRLFELAGGDLWFAPILQNLKNFGYEIAFPFWGQNGSYHSEIVQAPDRKTLDNTFIKALDNNNFKAKFRLSPRYGFANNAHSFLHELTHFHQDCHGLFLLPALIENQTPVLPDMQSYIRAILFCEAMAMTEAIRASWDLKQKKSAAAWLGAASSPDWAKFARQYRSLLQNSTSEERALAIIFQAFYQSPLRKYYESHSLMLYTTALKKFAAHNAARLTERNFRSISLPCLLSLLSSSDPRPYFRYISWDAPFFCGLQNPAAKRAWGNFQADYGAEHPPGLQNLTIGSPAYLWWTKNSTQNNQMKPIQPSENTA